MASAIEKKSDLSEKMACTKLDCEDEIWDMLSSDIAYCCGRTQAKLITVILIVVIIIWMAYTYFASRSISITQGLFLSLAIGAYFLLPGILGKMSQKSWTNYDERMNHLVATNPEMTRTQAQAEISRTELAKRTQREMRNIQRRRF